VEHGGAFALHYDPKIIEPIRDNEPQAVDMWAVWELINVPVLTVRGESSDLLLPETFARMQEEGSETLVVRDAGHAPALMDEGSMSAVAEFLEG
jgi:pimeloyl-ACP methyl ester carboxylesterase